MIDLVICLIIAIAIVLAVLAVVRAALGTPLFAGLQPYSALIYALFVLLMTLFVVRYCFGGLGHF